MKNLKLKWKIAGGLGALLLILIVVGSIGYFSISSLTDMAASAKVLTTRKIQASELEFAIEQETNGTRGFLLRNDESLLKSRDEGLQAANRVLADLHNSITTDQGRKLLAQVDQDLPEFQAFQNSAIGLRRQNKIEQAIGVHFSPEATAARERLRASLKGLDDLQQQMLEDVQTKQETVQKAAHVSAAMLTVAGLVLGAIIVSITARALSGAIRRMLALINEIAQNNLAVPDLEVSSHDEIGEAVQALNKMKNSLAGLISDIGQNSERLASASEQISASATQQSAGAEAQKEQTQHVATAMQEMASTVLQISDSSNKAADTARRASETAREGGKIVECTLEQMRQIAESVGQTAKKVGELGKSSKQIGEIIGVIDDIADQTNLLALNAAIEAARAGEQGRGFAVVADEVRKLAERTSKATKEITGMIRAIQDETANAVEAMESGTRQVQAGVETTTQAGASLGEIIQSAEKVGEMVTHIATAATQQSSATEEVNANVDQISRITQESAAGAQQSARACQDLSNLALDLQNLVSRFHLSENGKRSVRALRHSERSHALAHGKLLPAHSSPREVGVAREREEEESLVH
jgi:methyl-accepting chemotaxis protein